MLVTALATLISLRVLPPDVLILLLSKMGSARWQTVPSWVLHALQATFTSQAAVMLTQSQTSLTRATLVLAYRFHPLRPRRLRHLHHRLLFILACMGTG